MSQKFRMAERKLDETIRLVHVPQVVEFVSYC